ncbi:complex I NDUFA9 subunit family protein [Rhizobiaceae bacterium BDR2-2]|uniref:Complex I NDUFA9 subunit family protein n=1 Tax=Ectorhizobium quercum TaxID=2965071 RepID=A0AAE3MWQ1_9HYPH|nr:complex I NDUFA9 subunit family protein [Ectorhizobium quercum]MCX8995727.1 complex I NDUFA9 subunit family protein [Ectorhizobium quercum]
MTLANLPPLVTVFGGSGFVGRYVVGALAKRGYRIRVACRRPDLALFLQPLGNVGQISFVQANLRYPESVAKAAEGSDHIVNCVGLLFESGKNTFLAVQDKGAAAVAAAARAAGAKLTHVSAIGADASSSSAYASTKGRAEKAVLEAVPDAVILRPSVVFGPEDDFFNKFAAMARLFPVLPLIGGGQTKFQPVYAGDVAEVVARSVDGTLKPGAVYELGGEDVLSFEDCLKLVLKTIGRKRVLVTLPFGLASLIGRIAEKIPLITPPITADQVELLHKDNVVSAAAKEAGLTLEGLGIAPVLISSILPDYTVHFRPQGQFTRMAKTA